MDNYSIQLCLLAFTAIGAIATAIGIWYGHRDHERNQRVELYATYTKRYQEILIRQKEAIAKYGEDPGNPEVQLAYRLYFDLCCEEKYQNDQKYLHKDLWNNWLEGMKEDFNRELCLKMWEIHRVNYNCSLPFFEELINNNQ